MIRRLIVPLTFAVVTIHAGQGFAQGAFPAPLPGQAAPANNASPFPPVNGASPSVGAPSPFPSSGAAPIAGSAFERGPAPPSGGPSDACMKSFVPLREEAEKRGKMIKYVETNSTKCGIPPQIADQLKNGHKNTEKMQKQVCTVAQQRPTGPAGPSLSEVLGSAAALPEAQTVKKGGSTFDTLNGNVLAR